MILETKRLLLREMVEEDLPALEKILQDDQTMYAYEGAFSAEETVAWLHKQIANYQRYRFGLWAVVEKESGLMIGQCGLTRQLAADIPVIEIGYLFNRQYWHKGYAIEAASACKDYAFEILGEKEVYSIIRDINISSMNVAIRNGMLIRGRFIKHYRGIEMPHFIFSAK